MRHELSWTHYRILLRVENPDARSFYENEAVNARWSTRELERQVNSLLFERLALSRDKPGLLKLAAAGHEIQQPTDLVKDPYVLEFTGLSPTARLREMDLEEALIDKLRAFLLELGKGFAFLGRQELARHALGISLRRPPTRTTAGRTSAPGRASGAV